MEIVTFYAFAEILAVLAQIRRFPYALGVPRKMGARCRRRFKAAKRRPEVVRIAAVHGPRASIVPRFPLVAVPGAHAISSRRPAIIPGVTRSATRSHAFIDGFGRADSGDGARNAILLK